MRVYKEMNAARVVSESEVLQRAANLAQQGEIERACLMVERFVEKQKSSELTIFGLRETVAWQADLGRLDEAADIATRCAHEALETWGYSDERTMVIRCTEMYRVGEAGRLNQAIKLAEKLMADGLETLSIDDPLMCAIQNNSARIYDKAGMPEAAQIIYRRLLKQYEKSGSSSSEAALTTRNNYVQSLLDSGEYEQTVELLRTQILLLTEIYGCESPEALNARHEIGMVSLLLGKVDLTREQWEALYQDCVEHLHNEHVLTLEVASSLFSLSVETDDIEEVIRWSEVLISSLRRSAEPEILGSLIRIHNEYLCRRDG